MDNMQIAGVGLRKGVMETWCVNDINSINPDRGFTEKCIYDIYVVESSELE